MSELIEEIQKYLDWKSELDPDGLTETTGDSFLRQLMPEAIAELKQAQVMREALEEVLSLTEESPPEFVGVATWDLAVERAKEALEAGK